MFVHPSLTITTCVNAGRCVICEGSDIEKDELIFYIPSKMIISRETVVRDDPNLGPILRKSRRKEREEEGEKREEEKDLFDLLE